MKSTSYELENTFFAYLAGLIDGEGWIGISRRKRTWKQSPSRTHYFRPVIVIGMNKRECVDFVASKLGLGVQVEGDTFRVRFYPAVLRVLLPQLLPYLVMKRRQAQIILEYFVTEHPWHGKLLSDEEYLRRELLVEEMRRLNERPAYTRRRLAKIV